MDAMVSIDQVRYVAHLSRLRLGDEEEQAMAEQLGRILAYAAKLNQVDTTTIAPTSHAIPLENVLREDEPAPSLPVSEALANAPRTKDGCFQVPRVLR